MNLLKHLLQVSNLLLPGGKFFVVLPDKRFTFDHFRPLTTLSDVLLTFAEDPLVHSLHTIVENECEASTASTAEHQEGNHGERVLMQTARGEGGAVQLNECFEKAITKYYDAKGAYIDAHRWVFTDHWFYELIGKLNALGVLPALHIETLYSTVTGGPWCTQFYAILSKQ